MSIWNLHKKFQLSSAMGLRDFDLQSQPTLMGGNPLIVVQWTLTCFRMPKFQKKNSAVPSRWISTYIKPGSKRFLSWDTCRGLNFALEVGPFCMVSLVTLQKRSFEHLATISARLSFTRLLIFLGSKCLVMVTFDQLYIAKTFTCRLFLFLEQFFTKAHRKSQENNFE